MVDLHEVIGDGTQLRDIVEARNQPNELIADLYAVFTLGLPNAHAESEFGLAKGRMLFFNVLLGHAKAFEEDEGRELGLGHDPGEVP